MPKVSIINPRTGEVVKGRVIIKVEGSDNIRLDKIEFYIDNKKVGEDNKPPYEYDWDTVKLPFDSIHSIKAKGYDSAGNTSESPIITVRIGDMTLPEVRIINPKEGEEVSGVVLIKVDAKDDVGIEKVEFLINNVLVEEKNKEPYEYSWNTSSESNANYNIKVIAYDKFGNYSSESINVSVNNIILPQEGKRLILGIGGRIIINLYTLLNGWFGTWYGGVVEFYFGNNLGTRFSILQCKQHFFYQEYSYLEGIVLYNFGTSKNVLIPYLGIGIGNLIIPDLGSSTSLMAVTGIKISIYRFRVFVELLYTLGGDYTSMNIPCGLTFSF